MTVRAWMARIAATRVLARILAGRSAGIRDLEHGDVTLVGEDEPPAPLLDGITYARKPSMAPELVECVANCGHLVPCGIGVRADDTTAATLAPASFLDGGWTP